jgi:hypothetical protein
MKGQGVLPTDGMSAAAEKMDFGVSRWQPITLCGVTEMIPFSPR